MLRKNQPERGPGDRPGEAPLSNSSFNSNPSPPSNPKPQTNPSPSPSPSAGASPSPSPTPSPTPRAAGAQKTTVIGEHISFAGDIKGNEDLIIQGEVKGSVILPESHLTVGPQGKVEAEITAANVTISGRLLGNITSRGKVEITKEADFCGEIKAKRISVEDGAYLKASIELEQMEPAKPAATTSTTSSTSNARPATTSTTTTTRLGGSTHSREPLNLAKEAKKAE